MGKSKKPSKWLYLFCVIPFILGIIIIAILVYSDINSLLNSVQRGIFPGSETFHLNKKGKYILFFEYKSFIFKDPVYSTEEDFNNLEISLKSKTNWQNIPLQPLNVKSTYNFQNRKGIGKYSFTVNSPGYFELSAYAPKVNNTKRKVILTIVQNFNEKIFFLIIKSISIFGFCVILSIVCIIIIYQYRKKQLVEEPVYNLNLNRLK